MAQHGKMAFTVSFTEQNWAEVFVEYSAFEPYVFACRWCFYTVVFSARKRLPLGRQKIHVEWRSEGRDD